MAASSRRRTRLADKTLETIRSQINTVRCLLALCRYEEWQVFVRTLDAFRNRLIRASLRDDGGVSEYYKMRGANEICDWIMRSEANLIKEKVDLEKQLKLAESDGDGDSGTPTAFGKIDLDHPNALNPFANREVPHG
jgi:hypothetical protein